MINITYPIPLLTKLSLLVPRGLRRNVIGTSVIGMPFFLARIRSSGWISKFLATIWSRRDSTALHVEILNPDVTSLEGMWNIFRIVQLVLALIILLTSGSSSTIPLFVFRLPTTMSALLVPAIRFL